MGKLIVLEGLDGSGKTTQAARLLTELRSRGLSVRPLSFPAYEDESSVLVRMYLSGKLCEDPDEINGYAASMFFAADRYVTFVKDWKKDWEDPDTLILATRYTTANAYHQLAKIPKDEWDGFLDWLFDFEFRKIGLPAPDTVFLLDVPYEISGEMTRLREKKGGSERDIHEKDADYEIRCREAALYAAEKLGWIRIPCAEDGKLLPRETITSRILSKMDL
ncbi:MAG: thymidylate kinase [Clostridia bacterium]|nr:thymidylate kinase [Clostridia bacterium]